MAGAAQLVARLSEQQVGVAHQLVKRVQVPPRALDTLQRLRHLADGLDRLVGDALPTPTRIGFCVTHGATGTHL